MSTKKDREISEIWGNGSNFYPFFIVWFRKIDKIKNFKDDMIQVYVLNSKNGPKKNKNYQFKPLFDKMATQIGNIKIKSLKRSATQRPAEPEVPPPSAPTQAQPRAINIPEIPILQQIPGIAPFFTRDLIPDLVYLLQYESAHGVIDGIKDRNQTELEGVFKLNGLSGLAAKLDPNSPQEMLNKMYTIGAQRLIQLIAKANPKNPSSLIFDHPSQQVHVETLKNEIDLILNEPDVVEEGTIECTAIKRDGTVCGSKKVSAVRAQIRRADEPTATFARCLECKHRWQFY